MARSHLPLFVALLMVVVGPMPICSQESTVSKRHIRELLHDNPKGWLTGVRFSPGGTFVTATDYSSGTAHVWNVNTGKRLTTISTGFELRGSEDVLSISEDWRVALASRNEVIYVKGKGDDLTTWSGRRTGVSDVRLFDLETGKVNTTFKKPKSYYFSVAVVAPDGKSFATLEHLEDWPPSQVNPRCVASIWNIKSGERQVLPGKHRSTTTWYGLIFAADSAILAVPMEKDGIDGGVIELFDAKTAKPIRTLLTGAATCERIGSIAMSSDGGLVVARIQIEKTDCLKLWSAQTGKELASIESKFLEMIHEVAFSSDGCTIAASTLDGRSGDNGGVRLFEVKDGKAIEKMAIDLKESVAKPVFNPSSTIVAVASQKWPERRGDKNGRASGDLPDSGRISLIDVRSGKIVETLPLPSGQTSSLCFSPEGFRLAAGSAGKC